MDFDKACSDTDWCACEGCFDLNYGDVVTESFDAKLASLTRQALDNPNGFVQCQHPDSHAWYDLSGGHASNWKAPDVLAEAIRIGFDPHELRIDPTPF